MPAGGWDARRKTSIETTYQLSFYKHYFSKISGISLEDIKTHFCLLKRTSEKNRIEIFESSCRQEKNK